MKTLLLALTLLSTIAFAQTLPKPPLMSAAIRASENPKFINELMTALKFCHTDGASVVADFSAKTCTSEYGVLFISVRPTEDETHFTVHVSAHRQSRSPISLVDVYFLAALQGSGKDTFLLSQSIMLMSPGAAQAEALNEEGKINLTIHPTRGDLAKDEIASVTVLFGAATLADLPLRRTLKIVPAR